LSLDGSMPPLGFRQFQVIDLSHTRLKPNAEPVQAMVRAIAALHDGAVPVMAPAPAQRGAMIDRRMLIGGGAAAALGGAGLVGWATGLIGGKGVSATSIAVLPFVNLSGDPSQSYFSDGLAAEIRAQLTRNELLQVAAQASSNQFRERKEDAKTIARRLRVAYFLDGNVRRSDTMVKVYAELINGKTGTADWQKSFERPLENVFAVQTEIAADVASALSVEMDPDKDGLKARRALGGTDSVAAFDAYLRGKDLYDAGIDEASDRLALAKFDEAIAEDGNYAAAHAARCRALTVIANLYAAGGERRRLFDMAVAAGRRAVALASDFAEAHSALGFAIANGLLDMRGAREPYDRSYALGRGDADVLSRFAVFRSRFGDYAAANTAILASSALDPLNARTFRSIGDIEYGAGNFAKAITAYQKALEISPKLSTTTASIGYCHYLMGELDKAAAMFAAEAGRERMLTGTAIVAHKQGRVDTARAALAALQAEFGDKSEYQYGQIHAQWGDIPAALAALQRARKKDDSGLVMLFNDPLLKPLRGQAAFNDLLKSVGFV
jgi:TolB-like protein/Tfp pilus assembly protein PilF